MDDVQQLRILYTGGLQGDLQLLPRLYTYLQRRKREQTTPLLLLDIGASCADEVWHCALTGGRSTLIVLDGMGYHAVNVVGFLAASQREALKNVISTGMVDATHAWRLHIPPLRDEGILVAAVEVPALRLCIVAAPAAETTLEGRTLRLRSVAHKEIGHVLLDVERMHILAKGVEPLPDGLQPDPTIAAAVEFVEDEARYLQKRQS